MYCDRKFVIRYVDIRVSVVWSWALRDRERGREKCGGKVRGYVKFVTEYTHE